jgi:hypothetical protein
MPSHKGPSREARRELERPPLLPARSPKPEDMARIVIEIQPETPISVVWRLYAVEGPRIHGLLPREQRMLRKGAHVYGGTKLQAHRDAIRVAEENGFVYRPPEGFKDDPAALETSARLVLPSGVDPAR